MRAIWTMIGSLSSRGSPADSQERATTLDRKLLTKNAKRRITALFHITETLHELQNQTKDLYFFCHQSVLQKTSTTLNLPPSPAESRFPLSMLHSYLPCNFLLPISNSDSSPVISRAHAAREREV